MLRRGGKVTTKATRTRGAGKRCTETQGAFSTSVSLQVSYKSQRSEYEIFPEIRTSLGNSSPVLTEVVPPGSAGGDCGCASRERAGVAGPGTSALPLSGPDSSRDGERPWAGGLLVSCLERLWVWGRCCLQPGLAAGGCSGMRGHDENGEAEGGTRAEARRKGRAGR